MFRASTRLRRSPLPLFRASIPRHAPFHKSIVRLQDEAVNEYKVRFKNPGWTPQRLATLALYSTCITGYLWYFAPEVEVEVEIQEGASHGQQSGQLSADQADHGDFQDSEYAEEDSLFVPLTWAWKLPRTYYKGSDPEWQDFVKIAKDQPRHKRISRELAEIIYQGSIAHPLIAKQLGRDPKVGKYWLDISFPDGPPQEYARSGIEIGDDFIALSTQRLSPEQQHRVSRALWPAAAFNGLYASTKVILSFQYRRLKQAFGLESTPEPGSTEARMQHMLQMLQAQQQQKQDKLAPGKAQSDPSTPSPVSGSTSSAPASGSEATKSMFPWLARPPTPASSVEMPLAFHVFNSTLAKGWMPKKLEPPRGTFVVQGMIQVKGSRAVLTFDVNAFYSPRDNKFVVVNASPRILKKWNQAPRGGE